MGKSELKEIIKTLLIAVVLYVILGKVGVVVYGAIKVWKLLKD